jgi:hypothetical protein
VAGIVLAAVAVVLSQVASSRHWFHETGRYHDWYHLALFAVLGLLATLASPLRSMRVCWLIVAAMLGFAIECGEALRYGGLMEWRDVRTDIGGIAVGALVGWMASRGVRDEP